MRTRRTMAGIGLTLLIGGSALAAGCQGGRQPSDADWRQCLQWMEIPPRMAPSPIQSALVDLRQRAEAYMQDAYQATPDASGHTPVEAFRKAGDRIRSDPAAAADCAAFAEWWPEYLDATPSPRS